MKTNFFLRIPFLLLLALFPFSFVWAKRVKKVSKSELAWFEKREWAQGILPFPDSEIDIASFVRHYKKYPGRWDRAFQFIRDHDLATLSLGKKDLGGGLTVSVEEYTTHDPASEALEGHKQKIDLQYVVKGKELQGFAKIADTIETVDPYSEKKDVAHYKVKTITYHVAQPDRFMIYFPDDIHLTNVQYGDKSQVRKVVFKILAD
jgi:YhcH/YjgK/YiaL family protein